MLLTGELVEVAEDEEGDDDSAEDFEKEQWAKLEAEKATIMSNKNMLSEVSLCGTARNIIYNNTIFYLCFQA